MHRIQYCDEQTNNENLRGNLDALEELRDTVAFGPQPINKH